MADIRSSTWSTTAGDNNASPPDGWPEGQSPSSVNNCAREMMAAIKRAWNDDHPVNESAGSNSAYTLVTSASSTAYATGDMYVFRANHENVGTSTLNVNGIGVKSIKDASNRHLSAGTIKANQVVQVAYEPASDVWQMVNAAGTDADDITYRASGTGAVDTTVQEKLREFVSVKDFGAVGDGVTDDTTAIQAALDSGATTVLLSNETSVINGTITIPPGVTLKGESVASEYFPTGPGSSNVGSLLLKPSGGTDGPIVILQSGSGLANCYLKHLKSGGATTGIVQIGLTGNNSVYNSHITNVHLYGDLTTDLSGSTTCYGIYYPDGEVTPNTYQRYFNRSSDFYITNCDVAIRLGANCNANVFTGFVTRQCYQHFLLDGVASNQQCVENVFSSFISANIGALPTSTTTVFTLKNYALFNVFTGYATEANGTAFNIDATSNYNKFQGSENEITSSYVPPEGISGSGNGSIWNNYARPQNIEQYSNMILPGSASGSKYDIGVIGSRQSMIQSVSGGTDGLPALNGSGTLAAATDHSRVIIQLNSTVFKKTAQPNFRGRLTLWVSGFATATHVASVEFGYVVSNSGTSAGLFEVYEVNLTPSSSNFISGLKFISGSTAGTEMRIAVVGGNLSATPAQFVVAALDLDVFAPIGYARDTYFQHTFISTAATADDVTDAIDMLTVGETAV